MNPTKYDRKMHVVIPIVLGTGVGISFGLYELFLNPQRLYAPDASELYNA